MSEISTNKTEDIRFCNFYRCSECGTEWQDDWSCTCNDRCPECNTETEPYKSEDIHTMNYLELIAREMQTDDSNWDDQSRRLKRLYDEATPEGKRVINDALICVCGWSMTSLTEKLNEG